MEAAFHALLIIIGFGAFFFIAMWVENKVLIKQGKSRYDLRETIANIFSSVLYKSMDAVVIILFVGGVGAWLNTHGLQLDLPKHWLTYLGVFILQDFCFWLFHVVAHKMRFAWVSHKIHHSSRHFNFGVALRQSLLAPLPFFSISFIVWAPFAFLGLDIKVVAFIYELNLFYQFWIHTRVIDKFPAWIEFIFNTPSHHRVHPGYGEKQIDCNYAGVFIIWDRLFGTFVNERDAGEILYGVKTRQVNSSNVLVMVFEELIDMLKSFWKNKDIRHLWKHPDWHP